MSALPYNYPSYPASRQYYPPQPQQYYPQYGYQQYQQPRYPRYPQYPRYYPQQYLPQQYQHQYRLPEVGLTAVHSLPRFPDVVYVDQQGNLSSR